MFFQFFDFKNEIFKEKLNKEIGKIIKERREKLGLSQQNIADAIGATKSAVSRWEAGEIENIGRSKIQALAKTLDISPLVLLYGPNITEGFLKKNQDSELSNFRHVTSDGSVATIKIYGRIPAGVPLYAIEDIKGEIDIPAEWLIGDKEFIALEIEGDSMYPKYLPGDIVILQLSCDCESGQECAVYVNGDDATFKKVIKGDNYITLLPLNQAYEPKTFVGEQMQELKILGIAKEIRRRI